MCGLNVVASSGTPTLSTPEGPAGPVLAPDPAAEAVVVSDPDCVEQPAMASAANTSPATIRLGFITHLLGVCTNRALYGLVRCGLIHELRGRS